MDNNEIDPTVVNVENPDQEEIIGLPEKKDDGFIPRFRYNETKAELEKTRAELEALKSAKVSTGNQKLDEITSRFPDVDPEFIQMIATLSSGEINKKVEQLEKQIQSKEVNEKFETIFNKAIEKNPEFASVANKDVIKQLATSPANQGKTMSQLISEVYGNIKLDTVKKPTEKISSSNAGDIEWSTMSPKEVQEVLTSSPSAGESYRAFLRKNIGK